MSRSRFDAAFLIATDLQECGIEDARSTSTLFLRNCLLRRCVLRGATGHILWQLLDDFGSVPTLADYADVDWALDVREALPECAVNFHGVPPRLVRRSPDTCVHMRVPRDWEWFDRESPLFSPAYPIRLAIRDAMRRGDDEALVLLCGRARAEGTLDWIERAGLRLG